MKRWKKRKKRERKQKKKKNKRKKTRVKEKEAVLRVYCMFDLRLSSVYSASLQNVVSLSLSPPFEGEFLLSGVLFVLFFGAFLYITWLLSWRDPGVIPITAEQQQEFRRMQAVGLLPLQYCAHCQIKRPVRSQHCPILGRCVARYHCNVSALPRWVIFLLLVVMAVVV
jgi:hypothetical protein